MESRRNDSDTGHGSGDKTWWLTFSALATPARMLSSIPQQRALVSVSNQRHGLRQTSQAAQKMYYYQRFGIAKTAQYAGAAWADALDFPGDTACQDFLTKSNPQDLSGGWFDAGDYNK